MLLILSPILRRTIDNPVKLGSSSEISSRSSLINSAGQLGSDHQKELLADRPLKLENRPNPFSDHTQVYFEIPSSDQTDIPVIMRVYNTSGQIVKTLVHDNMSAGYHSVIWNGTDESGKSVSSGVYFNSFEAADDEKDYTSVKKIILLK